MPFLAARDSNRVSSMITMTVPHALPVVTTTIFPSISPSVTPVSQKSGKSGKPVPVGAIAGGTIAGVFIAVAVVIGWTCWGRSIKRTKAKQRREADALRTTRANTRHNAAALSTPRAYSYRPLFSRPSDTKIKFAPNISESKGTDTHVPEADIVVGRSQKTPKPVLTSPHFDDKTTLAPRSPTNLRAPESSTRRSPIKSSPLLPRSIAHKPSTVSSGSLYSTESGEEHQSRAPANLILAALGHLGNTVDTNRNSGSVYSGADGQPSSGWPFLSRPARATTQFSRLSQASSGSAYSQPEDQSGIPVGFAYGGD